MRIYRVKDPYRGISIFDPYTIAVLLALRERGEGNIGDINRTASKYAEMQPATTTRKLEALYRYGLVDMTKIERAKGWIEKRFRLTEKGQKIADALAEALLEERR
ncbi:MAG: hypothetical protein ACTSVA_09255 [Candidatus Njordarchaeales archaeon]